MSAPTKIWAVINGDSLIDAYEERFDADQAASAHEIVQAYVVAPGAQSQASLEDQLVRLVELAGAYGLYDAQDWLLKHGINVMVAPGAHR